MTTGNVLIVDDEDKLRGLLKRVISLEGYAVYEAVDLNSAARVLDREDINVVVCDVKLLPLIAYAAEKAHLQKRLVQLEELLGANDDTTVILPAFDLASVEKLHIQRVLNYTKGNKVEAARLLNIGLTTVYRKMEEYGLNSN
jgi:DNA-binding NtrC family response regulator